MRVSIFPNIRQTKEATEADITLVLDRIQSGAYQDYFFQVNRVTNKEERQKAKLNVPGFTCSGTFKERKKEGLIKHSGLIALDFDEVENYLETFSIVCKDPHTFAAFRSISGRGICCIVKIPAAKHLEAFNGLEEYFFKLTGNPIDKACKDVSRIRYVSYDPDLYHNPDSAVFKHIAKTVTIPKQQKHIHTEGKFSRVMERINTDIAPDYQSWVALGFAIASEFGEHGRSYFQHLSSFHADYKAERTDKQYSYCLKSRGSGVTIATFYYLCKQAGIETSTKAERQTELITYHAKQQGRNMESVKSSLALSGIEPDEELIQKVFETDNFNPIESNEKGAKLDIEEVEQWLRATYDIRKNEITRTYELNGKTLETENLNSIYLAAKKVFDKLSRELWDTILYSEITPNYNPIREYLMGLEWDGKDRIASLAASITSNTGNAAFREKMLRKWLLGIPNAILNEQPNILMLVLAGKKQGTGKSWFFKNLLPKSLQYCFAVSQLDNGKDDLILLTQKLLILDDEYSGKSKKDSKHMKYVLSANQFDLREPYGKKNVRLTKIASLCGTTNDVQILNDPTGNRRIIIFEVIDRCDFEKYNSVDKEQLFAQLVHLIQKGESPDLSALDVQELNKYTEGEYSESCIEKELLLKFYAPGSDLNYNSQWLTASEIKVKIETNTNQRLYHKRLGMELAANGFVKKKQGGLYKYFVSEPIPQQVHEGDDLPF